MCDRVEYLTVREKYFVRIKNVHIFAVSKNGDVVPCYTRQDSHLQVDKYVGYVSAHSQNMMQSEEK